jgi:hypothetical protein
MAQTRLILRQFRPDTLNTSSDDCTLLDLIAYFAGFAILAVFRQKPMKPALEA